jgi:hypothetical protein
MAFEQIFNQYQKYIAIAEKMHLHEIPAQEPVLAGPGEFVPPLEPQLEPQRVPAGVKKEIWRPIQVQEVVTKMREARN